VRYRGGGRDGAAGGSNGGRGGGGGGGGGEGGGVRVPAAFFVGDADELLEVVGVAALLRGEGGNGGGRGRAGE
jgi:hypothetical protein